MEVDDLHIRCNSSNGHITVGADGIFAASPDDSGDVSAMTVLVIGSATERIEVVDNSIMSLRVLQVVYTMHATVDDCYSNAGSVQTQAPCVVCQHADCCIIHLPGDDPIWRDISNIGIIGQQLQPGRRQANQQALDCPQVLLHEP